MRRLGLLVLLTVAAGCVSVPTGPTTTTTPRTTTTVVSATTVVDTTTAQTDPSTVPPTPAPTTVASTTTVPTTTVPATVPVTTVASTVPTVPTTTRVATTAAPTTTTTTTRAPTTIPATTVVPPTTIGSGFADAASTGPTGTLTARGALTITTPGTYENLNVTGQVVIRASNVTFRNSKVTDSTFQGTISVAAGLTGIVIDHVEVAGAGGNVGVWNNSPATISNCEISNTENGIVPANGTQIIGNWIHALHASGEPHYDGIQMDGGLSNITIRGNTIDLKDVGQTGAVMIDNFGGPMSNITVDQNRLLGGTYTVYVDGSFHSTSLTNVRVTGNRIGGWQFGPILQRGSTPGFVFTGNVNDSSGQPLSS